MALIKKFPYVIATNPAYLLAGGYVPFEGPVIEYITPTHGPDTGGTVVSVFGGRFTGATRVRFGNSFPPGTDPFVIVNDGRIDVTVPADLLDELVGVFIETPKGIGHKSALYKYDAGVFAPTSLAFNLAHRGSYAGAPWVGLATAGTSGSNTLESAGYDPAVGTPLNGFDTANFNAIPTFLNGATPGPTAMLFSDILSDTAYYFAGLVYIRTAPAPDALPYANPLIIGDDGGAMGVAVSSSGVKGFHLQTGSVYAQTGWAPLSLEAWHFVEWWYDGANIHIAVDGVAGTPAAATAAIVENVEHVRIGSNYALTSIDGLIEELWGAPTDLSAHSADMLAYVNARYNLSLPVFDPMTLTPSSWLRGSFTALPWLYRTLPDSPGAREVTLSGACTAGRVVNGIKSARYDSTSGGDKSTQTAASGGGAVLTDAFLTLSEYTIMGLVYVDSAPAHDATPYHNATIMKADARWGCSFSSSGIGIYHYDGGFPERQEPWSTGRWNFFCCRFGGAIGTHKVQVDVNVTPGTPTDLGSNPSLYSVTNSTANSSFNASVSNSFDLMERVTLKRAITDTERDEYYAYLKATYPSAGLP